MDLETMPRRSGRARAVTLAGLVLAAATVLAGCGDGAKSGSDAAASGTAAPSASAPAPPAAGTAETPSAPGSAPASPSAPAPVTTPPADPTATTPDPRPASPPPATTTPAPALTPTPAQTPPGGNGIAVGEPPPNGSQVHPAITYRVDGNRLTVWFYGGICQRYALKADESHPGRVDIRVTVAAPVPAGQACADLAKRQTVVSDLKQPLQGRTVTDLATGREVPLEADPHVGAEPVGPEIAGTP
ncbi:hypothetical protein ACFVYP_35245 [Kitasatospora sp. NPDC058201]|uniref:hypothetical protein n=1 Tax=Streptomycetaceae TaxID=2062 RepID=UPI002E770BED|nr:hypothetical protein [Streptomyces sp. BE303]MED7950972.1 hypothetical protein [Streptomyces sp. BE303]